MQVWHDVQNAGLQFKALVLPEVSRAVVEKGGRDHRGHHYCSTLLLLQLAK